jgi:hypothetical protein
MQAAGRGAASAARPDATDFRRSAKDRARERRHDAADRTNARSHSNSISISISISKLKSKSNSESEVQDLNKGRMAEWRGRSSSSVTRSHIQKTGAASR